MRLMLASLAAAAAIAPVAFAQTVGAQSAPAPVAPPASALPPAPQTTQTAQPPAAPPAAAPTHPAATAPTPPAAAPEAPPPPPPAPPPPPPPPTDPAAIAILDTIQNVCIPLVEGGNYDKLAKAAGYHKSDTTYVLSRPGFKFTLFSPGSNPNQCHIDMSTQVYPEGPAAALIVALHNWSAVERGWDLYRNDKSVQGNQELTTRSWEHDDPGKHEAMFITTYRHTDGSPMGHSDQSTLVYSEDKTAG